MEEISWSMLKLLDLDHSSAKDLISYNSYIQSKREVMIHPLFAVVLILLVTCESLFLYWEYK